MPHALRPVLAGLALAVLFIGCAQTRPDGERTATLPEAPDAAVAPGLDEAIRSLEPASYSRVGSKGLGAAGIAAQPDWNTEDYAPIAENGLRRVLDHPLSTFSIDVDAASYANVRRFIRDGMAPPKDAVRIEELVNYFDYDYPDPTGEVPFAIVTETGIAPWNPDHRIVHVGLQGRRMDLAGRKPSNLVFLLDVSGSMDEPDKLPLLKKAFRMLAGELSEDDRVAIVVYAGAAGLVLEPTRGDRGELILEALDRLEAGGSTAGAEGIRLAYEIARRHFVRDGINRVVLATDGDFNVGVSSDAELLQIIEQERTSGVFLTVLGFGTGNLKDNKMELLADHGNGNYYYIDSELEARKVLVSELGGTLQTLAKDVKLQIEFNPALVEAYRLIGYENRMLAPEDFADDRKDAGELGAGHSVTALYEVIPVGSRSATDVPSSGSLRYQAGGLTAAAASGELMHLALRFKEPQGERSRLLETAVPASGVAEFEDTSDDFRFSAAVAAFGMILRGSEFRGDATLASVRRWASGAVGPDVNGWRADFLRLVDDAGRLRSEG